MTYVLRAFVCDSCGASATSTVPHEGHRRISDVPSGLTHAPEGWWAHVVRPRHRGEGLPPDFSQGGMTCQVHLCRDCAHHGDNWLAALQVHNEARKVEWDRIQSRGLLGRLFTAFRDEMVEWLEKHPAPKLSIPRAQKAPSAGS